MKKKIFGALLVVAIAAGAMMNVNLNKVSNKGDLALANVEALADEIGPAPSGDLVFCLYGVQYGGIGIARNCSGCSMDWFISSYSGSLNCYK